MDDLFESDSYKKNLDSLKKAIKLGDVKKVSEQYNKTVRDLSKALEDFTDKAEDIAKFVIHDDLDSYVKLMNKKPSGFGILRRILDRISGRDVQIKNTNNFIKNRSPHLTAATVIEFINVLEKIPGLERMERNQEEDRLYGVNLENKTKSQQKENPLYEQIKDLGYVDPLDVKRKALNYQQNEYHLYEQIKDLGYVDPLDVKRKALNYQQNEYHLYEQIKDSGYESLSDEGHYAIPYCQEKEQKENPLYEQTEDSGYGSPLGTEPEYAEISEYQENKAFTENSQNSKSPTTVPKKHIEKKGERKQNKPPMPSVPEKIFSTNQEVKQKPKVAVKNKPKVPSRPKNLGRADHKVDTKPKVEGAVLKKSAESKPIIPLNPRVKTIAQKVDDKMLSEVASATMKNREMGSKVKALKEKFEQNQAKRNANIAEGKTTSAEQSAINPPTAKSNLKPRGSKNSPTTNVKGIITQLEGSDKKKSKNIT
ncbi:MAG: hypothetical protein ACR5K9_07285 [Wolbachia sp.]